MESRDDGKEKASALTVAILVHLGLFFLVGLFVIGTLPEEPPTLIVAAESNTQEQMLEKPEMVSNVKMKPAAPSSAMTQMITANATSEISVPDIQVDTDVEVIDLGAGFGDGMGMGTFGLGQGMSGKLPSAMKSRCSASDRERRLSENGGNPEVEETVMKSLRWLKGQQNSDGSFEKRHSVAITGLATLAFLAHCETPDSSEFGECVTKAITYLTEKAIQGEGNVVDPKKAKSAVYEQAIATYALNEAYSFVKYGSRKIPKLKEACQMSTDVIVKGQQSIGGFDYHFDQGARVDLSVAGWCVQALKAGIVTKLEMPGAEEAFDKAVDWVKTMQGGKGGFGYSSPGDKLSLAGVGCLALQFAGEGRGREVRKGVEFILDGPELDYMENGDLYAWYYNNQACFQRGGSSWTKWNRMMRDEMLEAVNDDGMCVNTAAKPKHNTESDIYRTCLSTLMLTVYYRYSKI